MGKTILKDFSELSVSEDLKNKNNEEEVTLKLAEQEHVSSFVIWTYNYIKSENLKYKDYHILLDSFSHFNAGITTVKTPNENGFLKVLKNNKEFNKDKLSKFIKKCNV